MLQLWQRRLGLEDYAIETEQVSIFQVSDDFCSVGNSFVGVSADHHARRAVIYHTRQLRQEDIVHELLHVRYPSWSEGDINRETGELLRSRPAVCQLLTTYKTL
ncbi:MAG: hypothetical protein ACREAO_04090 [Nitrososphaera sp.]